jgi:glyoxylase-like metal-dependent hydrolase (beta-lactamase superfamily II)/rhodanese-related sulfurtransferase
MKIEQFEDKGLAHYSYAVLSECTSEVVVIDPSRDVTSYLEYAQANSAKIIGVIETHPHADFISGHLELQHTTGATLYCSRLQETGYVHKGFDDGDVISYGRIKLKAMNTPGHSQDSISIVLEHEGTDMAVFTGDTLFIGDCGRPDLREHTVVASVKREVLAREMYASLRERLMSLADDVIVYPAHGAGTLCGKALSDAASSTIGEEKQTNWSLQPMSEADFVKELVVEQPFVPAYFPYDVALNKKGAPDLGASLSKIPVGKDCQGADERIPVIDTRSAERFKKGHVPGAINLQDGGKFETWLGSILLPEERFYLLAENEEVLRIVMKKTAKIGYEVFIKKAFLFRQGDVSMKSLDLEAFKTNPGNYTIVDVRNMDEAMAHPVFAGGINIPLHELRQRVGEIPTGKPIVVHCAGGYRSAAGSSIIEGASNDSVYDLGEDIKLFETV